MIPGTPGAPNCDRIRLIAGMSALTLIYTVGHLDAPNAEATCDPARPAAIDRESVAV